MTAPLPSASRVLMGCGVRLRVLAHRKSFSRTCGRDGKERSSKLPGANQLQKSVCTCACVQATSVRFQHILEQTLVSNQWFRHLGKQQVCSFRRSPFSRRNLRLCGTVQRVPDYGISTSGFPTSHGHQSLRVRR